MIGETMLAVSALGVWVVVVIWFQWYRDKHEKENSER